MSLCHVLRRHKNSHNALFLLRYKNGYRLIAGGVGQCRRRVGSSSLLSLLSFFFVFFSPHPRVESRECDVISSPLFTFTKQIHNTVITLHVITISSFIDITGEISLSLSHNLRFQTK